MKSPANSDDGSRDPIPVTVTESSRRLGLEAFTAICLTLARLSMGLALVLLTLASYALWGNPSTPMRGLWLPGVALLAFWLVFATLHHAGLRRLLSAPGKPLRDVQFLDSLSTTEIRKQD